MRLEDGVDIALTLVDTGGRRIDAGPDEAVAGVVCLRRWQVHPVPPVDGAFAGRVAHLVKINYDLCLDPDSPPVRWFEIGFSLLDRDSAVIAAVPRGSAEPQPATSYALSSKLEFVPVGSDAGLIHIEPTESAVHAYGASGDAVRWLHVAPRGTGIRPGSYSAWIVVLSPVGRAEQEFKATARFSPELTQEDDLLPVSKSAEFSISLTVDVSSVVDVVDGGGPGLGLPSASPRVFICYAHEDDGHKKKVRDFAELLRKHGLDPIIDQDHVGRRKDWDHWALREIKGADFVIVIASPACREVGDGEHEGHDRAGLRSELAVIRNLQASYPSWSDYVLPVVLPGRSVEEIPMFLAPKTRDHYPVEALTRDDIDYLLKTISATDPWQGWVRR